MNPTFRFVPPMAVVLVLAACHASPASHFATAKQRFAAEDYAAARVELIAALKTTPKNPDLLLWLARTQLRIGDGEGAQAALNRARALGVSAATVQVMAAETTLLLGKPDEALALLGNDASPDGWRVRAAVFIAKHKFVAAFGAFEQGMARAKSYQLLADYCWLLLSANDLGGTAEQLSVLKQLKPEGQDTLMIAATLAGRQGHDAAAMVALRRAEQLNHTSLRVESAQIEVLERMGKTAEALAAANRAAALAPNNPDVIADQLRLISAQGKWQVVRAKLEAAEGSIGPDSANAALYAEAMINLGNVEQARALLKRIVDQEPDNNFVRNLLAKTMLAGNDAQAAYDMMKPVTSSRDASAEDLELMARICEHIVGADPSSYRKQASAPEARRYQELMRAAGVAMQKSDWRAAQSAWSALNALRPGDVTIASNLAYAASLAGDHDAAIMWGDRALAMAPGNPQMLKIAGMARVRAARDLVRAKDLLAQSLSANPEDVETALYAYKAETAAPK